MSLVRVTAVGICGSDLHWWDEGAIGDAKLTHPLVLGHEGAGVIAVGHLPFGGTASVIGCGPIGLLLIGLLKAAGASSVLAVEPLAHRRAAAARLGADRVADPASFGGGRDLAGDGVDVAFEVAGND